MLEFVKNLLDRRSEGAADSSKKLILPLAEIPPDAALHKEFRIQWEIKGPTRHQVWYQNRRWGPGRSAPQKLCFYFDDLSLLDTCPFVCKFGPSREPAKGYKYFGVAYGDPSDKAGFFGLERMKAWAQRFPEVRIKSNL